jgi:hypothetical protein
MELRKEGLMASQPMLLHMRGLSKALMLWMMLIHSSCSPRHFVMALKRLLKRLSE